MVWVVVDGDEAASVRGQARDHPVGRAVIDARNVMFGLDCSLNVRAVQRASPAPPLGVLRPDEAFDHSPTKLRRAWDGIHREAPSMPSRVQDTSQIHTFLPVKKILLGGLTFAVVEV